MPDTKKLKRKWKSEIHCKKCNSKYVVEEWERAPFFYQIYCVKCKIVGKRKEMPR